MGVSNTSFPSPGLKSKAKQTVVKALPKKVKHQRRTKNCPVVATTQPRTTVVKFCDDVQVETYTRHAVESKPSLWWTREERHDIATKNQQLAREFRDYHDDKVEDANDVYDRCCCSHDDYCVDEIDSSDYMEYSQIDIPTLVRGLEWGFLPSSKQYRRTHSQKVLLAQSQISNLSPEMKARMISTRAVKSSRPSREFASILGQCDAEATKEKPMLGARNRCRMIPSWW